MYRPFLSKLILPAMPLFLLSACAPGYTGKDVEEGLKEDASQIGEQFEKDVKGTEKMADEIGDDLPGAKAREKQRSQRMAHLCQTSVVEINDLRQAGLSWKTIASICRLPADSDTEWILWEN